MNSRPPTGLPPGVGVRHVHVGSRESERGAATTETVIITAIFATLALAVGAIIVAKVTNKAESIPTDAPAGG